MGVYDTEVAIPVNTVTTLKTSYSLRLLPAKTMWTLKAPALSDLTSWNYKLQILYS